MILHLCYRFTYGQLNKVQCHVTIVSTEFNVDVDFQRRLITVKPLLGDRLVSIESTNLVIQRTVKTSGALFEIDIT